jgi:DNA invertase Pin-like site-specific DNA recombinase
VGSELVKPHHLSRKAIVYVRQSTPHQVIANLESQRLQYALRQRACDLGWHETDVEIVDVDLGQSGAAAANRQGFKEVVARVTVGEVGIILSLEVTRLARNCTDWYPLLDICGFRQCLIADRDGVYDPGTPNGRLLLGLKGTISELELHTLRGRLTAGLLAKAERGDLALMLPVGFVRDASGIVTKDPDQEVQARIRLVFDTFLQVRTAMRVVFALNGRALSIPRRDRHGDTIWRPATLCSVIAMLKNPAYAGAFVYGRTQLCPATIPGRQPVKVPRADGEWRFIVKNRYPGYIDWETFERIQTKLRDNRSEYHHLRTRGIPRDGAALLHGIAWCGECGHKMVVRYKGGSQYVCNFHRHQHAAPECQCLRAPAIDAAVAAAFLEAVAPAEIEAWERARQAQRQADMAMLHAETQQVDRLRYQVSLAERQFNRVDPDNRLVAAELERRWEVALLALRRAEEALDRRTRERAGPDPLVPALQEKITRIGRHLAEIWADPAVSREHRKALLRCLVEKVVMRRAARDRAAVRIVWRGGETTDLDVAMSVNEVTALTAYPAMAIRIRELADTGHNDKEIAGILTTEGYRSPSQATKVFRSTVSHIRRDFLRLGGRGHSRRWDLPPGWLSVSELAKRLEVTPNWIYARLRRGSIRLDRDQEAGRHLFVDDLRTLEELRKLKDRRVACVDLRQDRPHKEGHHYA